MSLGDFPDIPVAKTLSSQRWGGSQGSIPGEGTRSHVPAAKKIKDPACSSEGQRSHMPQLRPNAAK